MLHGDLLNTTLSLSKVSEQAGVISEYFIAVDEDISSHLNFLCLGCALRQYFERV